MIEINEHGGLFGGGMPTGVKNIQYVRTKNVQSITTVTISPVKVENTIVMLSRHGGGFSNWDGQGVELINSTTIRITKRGSTDAGEFTLAVIEFEKLKSKQTGIATGSRVLKSIPISPVKQNKALAIATQYDPVSGGSSDAYAFTLEIFVSSATELKFIANSGHYVYWQLAEFY